MIQLESIDRVFAKRSFAHSDGGIVEAILGLPKQFQAGEGPDGFFYCPYQIRGVGDDLVMMGVGIDEIEAVLNAIRMAGSSLYSTSAALEGKLSWDGESFDGDLGFPRELIEPKTTS